MVFHGYAHVYDWALELYLLHYLINSIRLFSFTL